MITIDFYDNTPGVSGQLFRRNDLIRFENHNANTWFLIRGCSELACTKIATVNPFFLKEHIKDGPRRQNKRVSRS